MESIYIQSISHGHEMTVYIYRRISGTLEYAIMNTQTNASYTYAIAKRRQLLDGRVGSAPTLCKPLWLCV